MLSVRFEPTIPAVMWLQIYAVGSTALMFSCEMTIYSYCIIESSVVVSYFTRINPLNAELIRICHLLALLGAHHILHLRRVRVKIEFSMYIWFFTR
jgi:hypothetical protein